MRKFDYKPPDNYFEAKKLMASLDRDWGALLSKPPNKRGGEVSILGDIVSNIIYNTEDKSNHQRMLKRWARTRRIPIK
jgi:hypothetical protein